MGKYGPSTVYEHTQRTLDTYDESYGPLGKGDWIYGKPYTFVTALSRTRMGQSLPNWKAIISAGGDATTPFSAYSTFASISPSSTTFIRYRMVNGAKKVSHIDITRGAQPILYGVSNDGTSEIAANNQAIMNCVQRLQARRTLFQGQIFLGEMGETIRMVADRAKSIRSGISKYVRNVQLRTRGIKGTRKSVKRQVRKTMSNAWLEYVFGWSPFFQDVYEGWKAMRDTVDVYNGTRTRYSGFGNSSSSSEIQHSSYGDIGTNVAGFIDVHAEYTCMVRYILMCQTKASVSASGELLDRYGITLAQFIPTIWELTPWSFLVDYFANVGDVLDYGAVCTDDVKFCVKTVRKTGVVAAVTQVNEAAMRQVYGNGMYSWSGSPGTYVNGRTDVSRSSLGNLPRPSFTVRVPGLSTKWINMAALSDQIVAVTRSLADKVGGDPSSFTPFRYKIGAFSKGIKPF